MTFAWRAGILLSSFAAACGGSSAAVTDGGARATMDAGDGAMGDGTFDWSSVDDAASLRMDASEGFATRRGTLAGSPFAARGAIAFRGFSKPGPLPDRAQIGIPLNFGWTCAFVSAGPQTSGTTLPFANVSFANQELLTITVVTQDPSQPDASSSLMPGTYPIVTGDGGPETMFATADHSTLDSCCGRPTHDSATNGSVSLSDVGVATVAGTFGPTLSGTFDLTFSNGDRVIGDFAAPLCNTDLGVVLATPKKVCVP